MKTFLYVILLFPVVAAASAPLPPDLPYHPYRIINQTHYDLRPLYHWTTNSFREPCPLPAWMGYNPSPDANQYQIRGVWPDGLLLELRPSSLYPQPAEPRLLFLTNYPGYSNHIDGERIKFFALRTGNYQYRDHGGSLQTVALYDYGVPYDPLALAREHPPSAPAGTPTQRQRTNATAKPTVKPQK